MLRPQVAPLRPSEPGDGKRWCTTTRGLEAAARLPAAL
jgi:hypothetical protein